MRLRTFQAPNMTVAMQMVRESLGMEAIIVSTHESGRGRGVTVTAAVEDDDGLELEAIGENTDEGNRAGEDDEVLEQILSFHGVPEGTTRRLLRFAKGIPSEDVTEVLGGAIDSHFTFSSVFDQPGPWVLIGPAGSGKTVTAAKLAAQLAFEKKQATIITTDTLRAGAVAQLQGYMDVLGYPLATAERPQQLSLLLDNCAPDHTVIIDTPGSNPFNPAEMTDLADFLGPLQVKPILVLAAGGDAEEAADIVRAFARFHCQSLIATRVDCCRRFGSLLAAADTGELALAEIGITASVAQGLKPLTPLSLARILTRDPLEKPNFTMAGAVTA